MQTICASAAGGRSSGWRLSRNDPSGSPDRLLYIGAEPDAGPPAQVPDAPAAAPSAPPAPSAPAAQPQRPAPPAAPRVTEARRLQGAVELRLTGAPGTKYRIYMGTRLVAFTLDSTPRLRVPANGRAVFRVKAVGPGGASGFSNRVIVNATSARIAR